MELVTVGKEIFSGFKMPIYYNGNELFKNSNKDYPRLSLIYIENGSGIIIFNEYEVKFTAPTILCMNETEFPKLKECSNISAKSISFHPSNINSKFNFNNIRIVENSFSSYIDFQDRYLLFLYVQRDSNCNGIINIDCEMAQQIAKLFQNINNELVSQKDTFWPCRSRSLLLELLILMAKCFEQKKEVSDGEVLENVHDIITYLHTNYQNKITLDLLASKFNSNRTTLNEMFYKATNLSIINYLIDYRINLASTFLRDTLIPISEIIERVGFNDIAHFGRTFKKHTGMSPSKYRNKYCCIGKCSNNESF